MERRLAYGRAPPADNNKASMLNLLGQRRCWMLLDGDGCLGCTGAASTLGGGPISGVSVAIAMTREVGVRIRGRGGGDGWRYFLVSSNVLCGVSIELHLAVVFQRIRGLCGRRRRRA